MEVPLPFKWDVFKELKRNGLEGFEPRRTSGKVLN